MKDSNWFKVYSYLLGKYFKRDKMVVKLIYVSTSTASYKILRNGKVVVTRLDDFSKDFSIVNYKDNTGFKRLL